MMTLCKESPPAKPLLLIFPFGLLSHYLRCLILAKQLADHFEVRFARSEKYSAFVDQEGFDTFDCLDFDSDEVMECVRKFEFTWMNAQNLRAVYLDQVRIIETLKPAAVLGDMAPTLKMAAEKKGVAYISLLNGYMSKYYGLSRKISRTHPAYRFLKFFAPVILNPLTRFGEAIAFHKIHQPFKKLRKLQQLSSRKSYLDELEGDINLICDLAALFPLKDLPVNYVQIQPLYYESGVSSKPFAHNLDKTKKTIFVSMGSTGDWTKVDFLNQVSFGKYNIVSAGDADQVLNAPHIIRLEFVNFHEVFPFTDLVICHGGNGTIYQSLLYGIPLLCKTTHVEQEWNVEALERVHAGLSLDGTGNMQDYIPLIDTWISRKEKGLYSSYRSLINRQKHAGSKAILELAQKMTGKTPKLA